MKKRILLYCSFLLIMIITINDLSVAKVKTVKIDKKKFNISMQVGDVLQLKIKKVNNKKIKWKSKNKSVATVSAKGIVKAKKRGKTTITAKAGKVKVTGKVKVVKKNNQSVTPVVTPAPMPEPTPVLTVTPAPTATPLPKRTSKPTATPIPTPKITLSDEILLNFSVLQEKITKETKVISGYVGAGQMGGATCYNWSEKFGNIRVTLTVDEKVIAEQIVTEDEGTFSFDVDFSEYEINKDILIRTTPTKGNIFTVENDYSICNYMVHGWHDTLSIEE